MSSTIEVVQFEPWHSLMLDTKSTDVSWLPNPTEQFARQAQHGPAWTMFINRRVACIGGTVLRWSGFGESWLVPSPLARTMPIAMVKIVREGIAYTMQSHQLRRLQAHVKTSDKRAVRFAQFLGYAREGTLRHYGADGSDYEVMAIVR